MSSKAWQRQIRETRADFYGDYTESSTNLKTAMVRECSRSIAKQIILEYEWLGTMVHAKFYTGIFFDGWKCGGALAFCVGGGGAGVNMHMQFGLQADEIAYLARGACTYWTPVGTASKLIAYGLNIAKRKGLKMAIAYADTDAGEIGTVYQATNWICIGRGSSTKQMVHPKTGRAYDQKLSWNLAFKTGHKITRGQARQKLLQEGFVERDTNPKWRYIYILAKGEEGASIRARIADLIVPYPKRLKDSSEPLDILSREGGATPTQPLQSLSVKV
jgi:hypothetical protein